MSTSPQQPRVTAKPPPHSVIRGLLSIICLRLKDADVFFSSLDPIIVKCARYDLTVCVGHLALSCCNPPGLWPPFHTSLFLLSLLPSVDSIWASLVCSGLLEPQVTKCALAKVIVLYKNLKKRSAYPSKRRVVLGPRWTISSHLGPPRVWSALCLLLGKTVELREETPDRMKPALLLSDPFLVFSQKEERKGR